MPACLLNKLFKYFITKEKKDNKSISCMNVTVYYYGSCLSTFWCFCSLFNLTGRERETVGRYVWYGRHLWYFVQYLAYFLDMFVFFCVRALSHCIVVCLKFQLCWKSNYHHNMSWPNGPNGQLQIFVYWRHWTFFCNTKGKN